MDELIVVKNELITLLEENQFEHLSQREQARLRDYFKQIAYTLQEAAEPRRLRRRVA